MAESTQSVESLASQRLQSRQAAMGLVTYVFKGGPLDGYAETLNGGDLDLSQITNAGTHTLELPAGLTLSDALDQKQVRLIAEAVPLRSRPHQIVRYRNAADGLWLYVHPDGPCGEEMP